MSHILAPYEEVHHLMLQGVSLAVPNQPGQCIGQETLFQCGWDPNGNNFGKGSPSIRGHHKFMNFV